MNRTRPTDIKGDHTTDKHKRSTHAVLLHAVPHLSWSQTGEPLSPARAVERSSSRVCVLNAMASIDTKISPTAMHPARAVCFAVSGHTLHYPTHEHAHTYTKQTYRRHPHTYIHAHSNAHAHAHAHAGRHRHRLRHRCAQTQTHSKTHTTHTQQIHAHTNNYPHIQTRTRTCSPSFTYTHTYNTHILTCRRAVHDLGHVHLQFKQQAVRNFARTCQQALSRDDISTGTHPSAARDCEIETNGFTEQLLLVGARVGSAYGARGLCHALTHSLHGV